MKTNRRPEPQWLTDWRHVSANIPRVCYTCDSFDKNNRCEKFDMEPPEDFAETKNACDQWEIEIGF